MEARLKERLVERDMMEVNISIAIDLLKKEAASSKRSTFDQIAGNGELVRLCTRLSSAEAFEALFCIISPYIKGGLVRHHGATFRQVEDRPTVSVGCKPALPARDELF